MNVPYADKIKYTLQRLTLAPSIGYTFMGAALTGLVDIVAKQMAVLPQEPFSPYAPTPDQLIINGLVPSALLLAGTFTAKPAIAWIGLGGLLYGLGTLLRQTVIINLSLLLQYAPVATTGMQTVSQTLRQHGY